MSTLSNPNRQHKRYLQPTEVPDVYLLNLDNTTFETFTTCPRRHEYSNIFGRIPEQSAALFYGSAIHCALESDLLGGTYEDGINVLQQHFADANFHPMEWRTFDHALDTYKQYHEMYKSTNQLQHWLSKPFEPLLIDGQACVEVPFAVPIGSFPIEAIVQYPKSMLVQGSKDESPFYIENIQVQWTGKIDVVVKGPDGLYIVDHKTASLEGPTFWKDFELSNQMRGYNAIANRLLGTKIKGVIIDALIGRKPTKTGNAHEFKRALVTYTDEQLDEWRENALSTISDMFNHLVQAYFPQQTKWCMQYGGCPFHQVCTMPKISRDAVLSSGLYHDNKWDPTIKH